MPGERLTCILQFAHVKYGGSVLDTSILSNAFAIISAKNDFGFAKDELSRETFTDLRKVLLSRQDRFTHIELQEKTELTCWQLCKETYKSLLQESDVFKIWRIFNTLADEKSFPPTISHEDYDWIIEKFATFANVKVNDGFPPANTRMVFQNFLDCLEILFSSVNISDALKRIHGWLVKEVLKGGWVYVRYKRRFHSSSWSRKWLTLCPGKLEISFIKSSKGSLSVKDVVYFSDHTTFKVVSNQEKGMKHVIQVSDGGKFECLLATMERKRMQAWLNALNESLSYFANGTSPVRELLRRKNDEYDKEFHSRRLKECEKSFILFDEEMKERKSEKENSRKIHIEEKSFQLKSVNTERDKIKAIFLDLDKNGNGVLEIDEFCLALQKFGVEIEKSEAEKLFNSIDVDNNGTVTFGEFYDYFVEKILQGGNSVLPKVFMEAEKKRKGTINFKIFSESLRNRMDLSLSQIITSFEKLKKRNKDEKLTLIDLQCLSFLDDVGIFSETGSLESRLKSEFLSCDPKVVHSMIEKRWNKFAAFKREGENGEIVMSGGTDIVDDIIPGKYKLQELSQFVDLPKLTPKKTVVRISWESSKNTTASGNLIFPADFDGKLETEIATSELLDYYGCMFADGRPEEVFIPYRHVIQDFTYKDSYLTNYVEGENRGAGLERHEFVHIDCPLDDDSGFFVLGKMSEDELHLTGFRVPKRHTLYVPADCIHSNDYLKGTWRTMLSDETNIDHVFLKRKTKENGENKLQSFTFSLAF